MPTSPDFPLDRPALLAALRARAARLDQGGGAVHAGGGSVPLCAAMDGALPGGGLACAALHEVLAEDPGAAAGFCALVLARARGTRPGTVLWIGPGGPGDPLPDRARFGLSPAHLVLVRAPRIEDGLWAMEEGLRCPSVAGAVLVAPEMDAAATRRLQVAAESGGRIGLLLRTEAAEAEAEGGTATAALTRWRVAALAGTGGGTAQGPGDPRWRLELLRCRGGRPRRWQVVWRPAAERLELDDSERPDPEEDAGTAGTTTAPPPSRRARRSGR